MDFSKLIAWSVFAACLFVVAPRKPASVQQAGGSPPQASTATSQPATTWLAPEPPLRTARADRGAASRRSVPEGRGGG